MRGASSFGVPGARSSLKTLSCGANSKLCSLPTQLPHDNSGQAVQLCPPIPHVLSERPPAPFPASCRQLSEWPKEHLENVASPIVFTHFERGVAASAGALEPSDGV